MGKAVGKILVGVAIIGAAFLTGGASLVPSIGFSAGAATASFALATTTLGGLALAAGASLTLAGLQQATAKAPKVSLTQLDALNASFVIGAPRVSWFGTGIGATDVRYQEPYGEDQHYQSYIVAVAAHRVTSIDELWIEDTKAWTREGGLEPNFQGYLLVWHYEEGNHSNYAVVNDGSHWGAGQTLTGCAHLHIQVERRGDKSPFVSGLPSRISIRGKGMPLYDPRHDSTVVGGSGPMRADDQSTWSFYAPGTGEEIGNNVALQALAYLLGWRIRNPVTNQMKLSVGRGLPKERLDLAGWITAANLCDETVVTSIGTQPRYHGAGLCSEADDPTQVLATFATTCNARFRERIGKLGLVVMHNDLALAATDPGLSDDELIGGFTWDPDPSLEECPNVVRGRYTDPSDNSLYQLVDYPEVRIDSVDGIDRILSLDLPWVQDAAMAQRLAKQALQRKQYQRQFQGVFNMAGWTYQVGDLVPLTLSALAFNRRLFRVEQQIAQFDGVCPMILTEENPAIYAWDADDRAPVVPAEPVRYDPANSPLILAGKTADWPNVRDSDPVNHPKPEDGATVGAPNGTPVGDKQAEDVVDELTAASQTAIALSRAIQDSIATAETMALYNRARMTIDGAPIGPIVVQVREQSETTASSMDLLGVKAANGLSFILNTEAVSVGDGQSLASYMQTVLAQYEGLTGSVTSLNQVVTNNQTALASSIISVNASLAATNSALGATNSALAATNANVSLLFQATVNADGSGNTKAVLALNVNGYVTGFTATNTGATSQFAIVTDKFLIVAPGGGTPRTVFEVSGGVTKMPAIEVDTLKVNTAAIPIRVTATNYVTGTYPSTTGSVTGFNSILTGVIDMPAPGWIEIQAKLGMGSTANGPWQFYLTVNGATLPESTAAGGDIDDNVFTLGTFEATTVGEYTVDMMWNAYTATEARERVMFVKGLPFTDVS